MSSRKPRPIVIDRPAAEPQGLLADVEPEAAALGEALRRVALGSTAALIAARACWPALYRYEEDSGSALFWSLLMLATALVAVASMWLEGGLRLRRSWADLGVLALVVLIGISATHAADRRIAINAAWEALAVGLAYLLLRSLPRTRGEVLALIGALAATAAAVALYGLYQVAFEFPGQRAFFLANPREALRRAGIDPDADPQTIARFRDRLVGSREPVATFALTNTLAGFLVGPIVVALVVSLRALMTKEARKAALLASPVLLVMLLCFLVTKSRSAYLGLLVAMLGLAWRERHRVSMKRIVLAGLGFAVAAGGLVAAAAIADQLDRQVLTESTKSLRYRAEYWRGAWGVITDGPTRWLAGLGPGNFAGPYLRHKLPTSSEEILDPHNLVLETWATAGLPAVVALLIGLALGWRECFARPSPKSEEATPPEIASGGEPAPPRSSAWLALCALAGVVVVAVALGQLGLFEPDPTGRRMNLGVSARWLVLGLGWIAAAGLGRPLWTRGAITADALGLGALAIAVNLLAAGGIGYAPVALMLWGLLALGQDLRDDRASGRRVAVGGRGLAFVPAAVLAALMGAFLGTASPFWRAEAAMRSAESALTGALADPRRAATLYDQAANADPFGSRALVARANLEFQNWRRKGAAPPDFTWHRIDSILKNALRPPRDPNALRVHRLRAQWALAFLQGPELIPAERIRIRNDRLNACWAASALYPTSAAIRAELADAFADLDRFAEAAEHGHKARLLDEATPHADKKLPTAVRIRLNETIPRWRAGRR